jgi:hypothetical protein
LGVRWFALFLPVIVSAQDWGGLHVVQGDVDVSKRFTLQLHARMRTNDHFGQFFQSRGGPIGFFLLSKKVSLVGGYYFIGEKSRSGALNDFHRFFGGAQYRLAEGRKWKLDGRTLVEQFAGVAAGNFQRGRQRMTMTMGRGMVRPYLQGEGLRQEGRWLGRLSGGVNVKNFAVGYELRQGAHGGYMHLITTTMTMRLRTVEK